MATTQVGTLLRHIRRLADGPCAPQETDRQLLDDFAARGLAIRARRDREKISPPAASI